MKKYHSEKDPFRDRTIIYDEHGKKVGYSEKTIFGDHVNVYDSKGNKVARQEKSFFGDHINGNSAEYPDNSENRNRHEQQEKSAYNPQEKGFSLC